jgi:hypothetical protein
VDSYRWENVLQRKAFLAPLTRYWVKPCCDDPNHHLNYSAATYLPALGASVFRLREYIRDSLYTRRTGNFRVVCANKLLGIGPNLSDDSAREISKLWGNDAVHPQPAAYIALARSIESDILQEGVHYTNTLKQPAESLTKRQKLDLSQSRQAWVERCSAAVVRCDTYPSYGSTKWHGGRGGGNGWTRRGSTTSRGRGHGGGGKGWRGK